MNIKNKLLIIALAVLIAAPFVAADSYQLWCLKEGETANLGQLCNPAMGRKFGPTILCMHVLNNGHICPTILNVCNGLGLACSQNTTNGGNTTIDTTPPTLEIYAPLNGSTHSSRNVLIDLSASEPVTLAYEKVSDPGRWTSLCSDCTDYSREKSFDEGLNQINLRAIDRAHNEVIYPISFNVDSKEPKLKSLLPNEGFVSGTFQISFTEDNPMSLTLHYGNSQTGFRDYSYNLQTECIASADTVCTTHVDLGDYDGQQLDIYATLNDAGGSSTGTKHYFVNVDNTAPAITNLSYVFRGKKATLSIGVDEVYFSSVSYIDNLENNPKEKTLCTKLVNNLCEKQISFNSDGIHQLTIYARDEAGNMASKNLTISTDSNAPKINTVSPMGGFASGEFEVIFEEDNPSSLILEYGNTELGFRTAQVSLSGCSVLENQHTCSKSVDLSDYDGQQIQYTFVLTDGSGQSVSKGGAGLLVDISYPSIQFLNYTVTGKNVLLSIKVDESFLKEITYIDSLDSQQKEKKLCTKLVNGFCEKKISFSTDGNHQITINVKDLADHVTAQSISFFTDSKKPKIKGVAPEKGFVSGNFEVDFEEDNPSSLILEYGNTALGFRNSTLSLQNDCTSEAGKYHCSIDKGLSYYEGYEISYNFILTDRVGQKASSGAKNLVVDTTFPVINALSYNLTGSKKSDVVIKVTEPNVAEITYLNQDDARPREMSLCSRINPDGTCKKSIAINPGTNRIDFAVTDKAGNSVVQRLVIQN